jgi:hypothetical protein
MDNFLLLQKTQGIQQLNCKDSDRILSESTVIVLRDELIEVAFEKLKRDALIRKRITICFLKMVKSLILTIPLRFCLSFSRILVSMVI